MLKFPSFAIAIGALMAVAPVEASAQDAKAGEKVYRKCRACHQVGDKAKNRVGPHLNEVIGRAAGTVDGFKYSKAMRAAGEAGALIWDDKTLDDFLRKPRGLVKGTSMAFAGLRKEADRKNIIAYLRGFSAGASEQPESKAPAEHKMESASKMESESKPAARSSAPATHGVFHLGRIALPEEVTAWDIDIRPDGAGLPAGKGTVAEGEVLYNDQCAVCHGDFGEGTGRWPILAGGDDTLTDERPVKTIGSYWPYLSTVYDYVRRAMPFGNARSLSDDDVYAMTAYLLYLNDMVGENFTLSKDNFGEIRLANEANFIDDGRASEAHYAKKGEPCMSNCLPGKAKIIQRARVLDVTPDVEDGGASE